MLSARRVRAKIHARLQIMLKNLTAVHAKKKPDVLALDEGRKELIELFLDKISKHS